MLNKIKKKTNLMKKWISQDFFFIKQVIKKRKYKKRIVLLDTADHDNLGDHAIAMAEIVFIKKYLPEYGIIEIPGSNILRHTWLYKTFISRTDILTIAGGGFLGSLWPFEEKIVQSILNIFRENKVIIFPQTFFVEENDQVFVDSHQGYMNHSNLLICLRDDASCNRISNLMPNLNNKILFMPDMVCGLPVKINNMVRKGVAMCFREDIECVLTKDEKETIKNIFKEKQESVENISMIEKEFISPCDREKMVNLKLKSIASKKLLITDRLHAMLFAAITGTPCIAMDNKSGKVQGVYQWIKNQPHVHFAQNAEQLQEILKSLDLEKKYHYDNSFIDSYWKKLAKLIEGDINE